MGGDNTVILNQAFGDNKVWPDLSVRRNARLYVENEDCGIRNFMKVYTPNFETARDRLAIGHD